MLYQRKRKLNRIKKGKHIKKRRADKKAQKIKKRRGFIDGEEKWLVTPEFVKDEKRSDSDGITTEILMANTISRR